MFSTSSYTSMCTLTILFCPPTNQFRFSSSRATFPPIQTASRDSITLETKTFPFSSTCRRFKSPPLSWTFQEREKGLTFFFSWHLENPDPDLKRRLLQNSSDSDFLVLFKQKSFSGGLNHRNHLQTWWIISRNLGLFFFLEGGGFGKTHFPVGGGTGGWKHPVGTESIYFGCQLGCVNTLQDHKEREKLGLEEPFG